MISGLPTRPRIPYLPGAGCYRIGLPRVHAAPRGEPHADEETPGPGADAGVGQSQPGAAPASAVDRACQQQC